MLPYESCSLATGAKVVVPATKGGRFSLARRAVCLFFLGRSPVVKVFLYIAPQAPPQPSRHRRVKLKPLRTFGPKGRHPSPLKGKRLTMICASLCSFKSCSLCTPEACPHLREAAINSSSPARALSASIRFFSFFGTRFSKGGMRPKFTFMGWKFFPSKWEI